MFLGPFRQSWGLTERRNDLAAVVSPAGDHSGQLTHWRECTLWSRSLVGIPWDEIYPKEILCNSSVKSGNLTVVEISPWVGIVNRIQTGDTLRRILRKGQMRPETPAQRVFDLPD